MIELGAWPTRIGYGARREFTRTAQARSRRLRTLGVALPARTAEETVTDLAHIYCESGRPVRMHTQVLSLSVSGDDDLLDASPVMCHSISCGQAACGEAIRAVRWACLGQRHPGLGLPCTQEHLRERTGMRGSAGRAPPRTGLLAADHCGRSEGRFVPLEPGEGLPLTKVRPLRRRPRWVQASSGP